jgi:hypothetical protein
MNVEDRASMHVAYTRTLEGRRPSFQGNPYKIAIESIIQDFTERQGGDSWWDDVEEETQDDIRAVWEAILRQVLPAPPNNGMETTKKDTGQN